MNANLLDDNLLIRPMWLKPIINTEICKYVQECGYVLNDLNDYNKNLSEIVNTTDMATLLSNLNIYEVNTGVFIEDTSKRTGSLRYYPFDKINDSSLVNGEYLQIV